MTRRPTLRDEFGNVGATVLVGAVLTPFAIMAAVALHQVIPS